MLEVTDATFRQEILEHDGPVLVDFWAPWCAPCRMLGPIVEKLAQDYAGKVKMAKLNVDENRATASQYRIMSIPTIIIFQNGQPVERISGLLPENQLKQLLDKVLAA